MIKKLKKYTISKRFKFNILNIIRPSRKLYKFWNTNKFKKKFRKNNKLGFNKPSKRFIFKQSFYKVKKMRWTYGQIPFYILKKLWFFLKKKSILQHKIYRKKPLLRSLPKNNTLSNHKYYTDHYFTKLTYLLECRLMTVVYRMNLASSFFEAKQLIIHGFIGINGKTIRSPNYIMKIGDVVHANKLISKKGYSKLYHIWNYFKKNKYYSYDSIIIKKKKKTLPLFFYDKNKFVMMPWEKVNRNTTYRRNFDKLLHKKKIKFFKRIEELKKKNNIFSTNYLKRNRKFRNNFMFNYRKYLSNPYRFLKKNKISYPHLEINSATSMAVLVNYPLDIYSFKQNKNSKTRRKKKYVKKHLRNSYFLNVR